MLRILPLLLIFHSPFLLARDAEIFQPDSVKKEIEAIQSNVLWRKPDGKLPFTPLPLETIPLKKQTEDHVIAKISYLK
jgi:hypothetical protein